SPRDDVRSVADTPPLPLVSLHARSPSPGAPCTSSQAADPGRGAHAFRWPRPARSRRRADGARPREPAGSAVLDGVLELVLVHRRTALHVLALRILVELLLGAPLRPGMRAFATALRGRLILDRGAARLVGLALLGAGLVHGAGGDLLRLVLGGTLVELAVLDVLVLALTLLAPCLGHDSSCSRRALACEMRTDRGPRARRRWRRWPLGPDPHPHARARRGRDSPPNGRGAGRACRAEGARSLPAGVPG